MNQEQDWYNLPANQVAIARFTWIFGAGLAISLSFPQILFAASVSTILGFSAGILATTALFARESIAATHLTRWDVAAALYALSLFTGFFVDLDSIQSYLAAHRTMAG